METAKDVDFRELYQGSQVQLASALAVNSELQAMYQKSQDRLVELEHQMSQLLRSLYASKHERFIAPPAEQLSFDMHAKELLASSITDVQQIEYLRNKSKSDRTVVKHPGRGPFPEHLRREDVVIDPIGVCETDVCIGTEVTEQLEYVPGELYVKRYLRRKFSVKAADGIGKTVVIADLPVQPIDKCIAGPALLAHMVIDKYVDSKPLHRQLATFSRQGVTIASSTFNDWLNGTCKLLVPFYELLKAEVLAGNYIHADETGMKVLDRDKKKTTHKGYFWVYQSKLSKLVFFDYQPSRALEAPAEVLKDYQGYLQVDGYQVYENIAKKPGITLLCCMAHVRREFEKALDNDRKLATIALLWFQKLYAIERRCKDQELNHEQILELRQKEAVPILDTLVAWMKEEFYTKKSVTPSSPIGKAMTYAMKRWDKLSIYTTNGMLDIDNNPVERSIRTVAVGRKNYMFAGSHEGAQRGAMLYSFMETCKMNDVNPYIWLKDILCRVHITPEEYRYLLLPHNWKPTSNPL
jgi:transposase